MKNFYTHGQAFDFTRYFQHRVPDGSKESVKLPKRRAQPRLQTRNPSPLKLIDQTIKRFKEIYRANATIEHPPLTRKVLLSPPPARKRALPAHLFKSPQFYPADAHVLEISDQVKTQSPRRHVPKPPIP